MICVIQRINSASVYADGSLSGSAQRGLYILLGVMNGDLPEDADVLAEKISKLRIFSDENGKMNLSVRDIDGEALVVSNFTLGANYSHGNRPDYLDSAKPEIAKVLYEHFIMRLRERVRKCECGVFGADMRTELSTDGPVTIVMDSKKLLKNKDSKGGCAV